MNMIVSSCGREESSQISLVLLLCGTCQLAIYLFTWLDYFSCPNPKFYLLTYSSQVHMRTLYRIWNIISMQKPSQILMQYGLQTQPCNIVLVGHGLYINLHGCILIKLVWTLFVTLDRRIFIKSDGSNPSLFQINVRISTPSQRTWWFLLTLPY